MIIQSHGDIIQSSFARQRQSSLRPTARMRRYLSNDTMSFLSLCRVMLHIRIVHADNDHIIFIFIHIVLARPRLRLRASRRQIRTIVDVSRAVTRQAVRQFPDTAAAAAAAATATCRKTAHLNRQRPVALGRHPVLRPSVRPSRYKLKFRGSGFLAASS